MLNYLAPFYVSLSPVFESFKAFADIQCLDPAVGLVFPVSNSTELMLLLHHRADMLALRP